MERARLKQLYGELYTEVEAILYRLDPIGINFGDNTGEYDPEVDTILPRLKEAYSESEVHNIIYEEFVRWFDADIVGDKNRLVYKEAAKEIWAVWKKFNKNGAPT